MIQAQHSGHIYLLSVYVRSFFVKKYQIIILLALIAGCTQPVPKMSLSLPPPPVRSEAELDSLDLLVTRIFPLQVSALIRGTLPDECTYPDTVTKERSGTLFVLTVTILRNPAIVCSGTKKTFEYLVPLLTANLPAGIYKVSVNNQYDYFEMPVDNGVPR
jgi:hypothetical protein